MEKHYLAPLFTPASVVAFAGPREGATDAIAAAHSPMSARVLNEALRAQRFTGTLQFLDIGTSGTLGDLAQTRADLAIIALPTQEIAAALEVAARIRCRSALVISSGVDGAEAAVLKKIAQREGLHLLGPNSLGFQRPHLQLNASAAGPLARPGSLALV